MTRPLPEIIAAARRALRGCLPTLTTEEYHALINAAERYEERTTELLEANNRVLERARNSEAREKGLELALLASARTGAELARMLGERL